MATPDIQYKTIKEFGDIPKRDDQKITFAEKEANGHKYIDIRECYIPEGKTEFKPTGRGFTLPAEEITVDLLQEIINKMKEYYGVWFEFCN